jgi:hypothetical protein
METALSCEEVGQGNTRFMGALADGLIGLRSLGQEVLEKRSGFPVRFVALLDVGIALQRHFL